MRYIFMVFVIFSSFKVFAGDETVATTENEKQDALEAEQEDGGIVGVAEGDLNMRDLVETFAKQIRNSVSTERESLRPPVKNKIRKIPVFNYDEIISNKILDEDSEVGNRRNKAIKEAMSALEHDTCLKFVQKNDEINYIKFTQSEVGCWSNLGTKKGEQEVSLSPSCLYKGTVMHEIMHALGFLHEHTRMDRNDYINIIAKNIKPQNLKNFDRYEHLLTDDISTPYDYYSIMHPPTDFFSESKHSTIQLKNKTIDRSRVGQRQGLSKTDIEKLNSAFECTAKRLGQRKDSKIGPSNDMSDEDTQQNSEESDFTSPIINNASPSGDLVTNDLLIHKNSHEKKRKRNKGLKKVTRLLKKLYKL